MKKTVSDFRSLLRSAPPLLVTLLVLSVVGMNLLANKSIHTGVPWLALDCGILFSWLTFLSMDVLTHSYGPRAATALSAAALGLNLLMALIFFIASRVPGEWGESYVQGSESVINGALDGTFGGTWFVILGSSVAFSRLRALNNFLNYAIGRRAEARGKLRRICPPLLCVHIYRPVRGQSDLCPAGEQGLFRMDARPVPHLLPDRRCAGAAV
jgi:uncharacterized membrane protein SirB2